MFYFLYQKKNQTFFFVNLLMYHEQIITFNIRLKLIESSRVAHLKQKNYFKKLKNKVILPINLIIQERSLRCNKQKNKIQRKKDS